MGLASGQAHGLGRQQKFFAAHERTTGGAITAFAAASTKTTVTSASHGLSAGEFIAISGTTSYNGVFLVETPATNTFVIDQTFVANDATGNWFSHSQGTFRRPAATDAVKTQTSGMTHAIANDPIDDNSDYRYPTEDIQDKETNSWSWDGYLIPSGAKATAPDIEKFLTAALGHAEGTASGWVWSVANHQPWPTLSLTRHFNSIFQQAMWGCLVDKASFKLAGGSQPMAHFEGRAMGYVYTGESTLDRAMAGDNDMLVQAADYYMFGLNSVVKIDADDGASDLGYRVSIDHETGSVTAAADGGGGTVTFTSADHGLTVGEHVLHSDFSDPAYNGDKTISSKTTDTYTVTATWTATGTGTWHSAHTIVNADADTAATVTEADDDPVTPHVPTPTYTGSPISGVEGAFEIVSVSALPLQSVEITLENNFDLFEDEIASQKPTDFVPGPVKVTVVIGFRVRQDKLHHLANPRAFATRDLFFRAGPDKSGKRFKFDIDYGMATMPDISVPKDGVGTATLTYVGYGSGANGPLIITHD